MTGSIHRITSLTNPQVKAIRALSQRKHRRATGTFLAEGLKLVIDGLDAGWPIETFLFSESIRDQAAIGAASVKARAAGAAVLEVTDAILEKIARRDNPQMVIGVFHQQTETIEALLNVPNGLFVALEGIKDPGNLGTIIRTAEAAGADAVILIGETTDPFGLEAVRASMGSLFHMKLARLSVSDFVDQRPQWPGRIVGTHLSGTTDFRRALIDRPLTILMGNEQAGLPERLAELCNDLVIIPMRGKADSLNLAVATGIVLFQASLGPSGS
ncbi:MAG: RNA methyltransferase [Pseudomonadota bacterium]